MMLKKYTTCDFDIQSNQDFSNFDSVVEDIVEHSPIWQEKQVIHGVIRSIDRKSGIVCVDSGLKSECFMSITEFFTVGEKDKLQVGDSVEVYVSKLDRRDGTVGLSRAKAIREKSWETIVKAYKNGETINGICYSNVRGGAGVEFGGVRGFLPGSHVDYRPTTSVECVMGKLLPYMVLSLDEKNRGLIVSRRSVLETDRKEERDRFLSNVKEGDILTGIVKNITNYGAFVDLDAVDGLLHVNDITWEKISHPSEVLQVGQKVSVKITKYDRETQRLSLGMKQLQDNPWYKIQEKYKSGTVVKGKIVNVTSYGAFVQLEKDVEGLLHVSEMGWTKDAYRKHKEMQIDQEIDVVVMEIKVDQHRIALSMRKLIENPWEEFFKSHTIGEVIEGTVRNITQFGMFVGVQGSEVDGLVHLSDVSWNKDASSELSKYNQGDKVKVIYLGRGSDPDSQRIRFGLKQLTEDPFEQYTDTIKKGDITTCTVTGIEADGIEVIVLDSIRTFIKRANIARERADQSIDKFTVGEKIEAKVIQYEKDTRKLTLSIKALEDEEQAIAIEKYNLKEDEKDGALSRALGKAIQTEASKNNIADELESLQDSDIMHDDELN